MDRRWYRGGKRVGLPPPHSHSPISHSSPFFLVCALSLMSSCSLSHLHRGRKRSGGSSAASPRHLHPCKLNALSSCCKICMATLIADFSSLPGTHFMQVTIPPPDTYKTIKLSPSPLRPHPRTLEWRPLCQQSGRLLLLALIERTSTGSSPAPFGAGPSPHTHAHTQI